MKQAHLTEATELALLLGYLAELQQNAMRIFVRGDLSAESTFQRAVEEFAENYPRREDR